MIAEIANDISSGLRDGVLRRYPQTNATSSTLRGHIDFRRLSIRYAPLVVDKIKWVAHNLLRLSRTVAHPGDHTLGLIIDDRYQTSRASAPPVSIARRATPLTH